MAKKVEKETRKKLIKKESIKKNLKFSRYQ